MTILVDIKTGLTGGASTDIDGIGGASLDDGDIAMAFVDEVVYHYSLDADSALAANTPYIIIPVSSPGDKRWILQDSFSRGRIGMEFALGYEPTTQQLIDMKALERDGSSLLDADYPELLAVWGGKLYGNADGTHFYLPDDGGKFERIWDHGAAVDPDAATRTDRGDGTTGDEVGTNQADQFELHAGHSIIATGELQSGSGAAPASFTDTEFGGNQTNPVNTYKFGGIFVK